MTTFGKLVFTFLIIAAASSFFYYKQYRNAAIVQNNIAVEQQKETDALRNKPFPLAGMDTGSATDWTYSTTSQGIIFWYPKQLTTKYIHTVEWPPKISLDNAPYACMATGSEIMLRGVTENETINARDYCVTKESEGAAGSIYTTYTYITSLHSKSATINFTLRAVQCGNYDDPQKTECENERKIFDIGGVVDTIVSAIQFAASSTPPKR